MRLNSEFETADCLHPPYDAEIEAGAMRFPLRRKQVFAYFGAMLGSLPPASIFIAFAFRNGYQNPPPPLVIVLMSSTIIVASIAGYQFGKVIGTIAQKIERRTFSQRILLFALLGLLWGIVAGAAGGIFIFIIGALFGAALGGAVGAIALPLFAVPYIAVRRGTLIELRHFLPISLGVTLLICAYILGSLYR